MLNAAENRSLIKVPNMKFVFLALLGSLFGAILLQQDEGNYPGNYPGNENSSSSHTKYSAYMLSHEHAHREFDGEQGSQMMKFVLSQTGPCSDTIPRQQ